ENEIGIGLPVFFFVPAVMSFVVGIAAFLLSGGAHLCAEAVGMRVAGPAPAVEAVDPSLRPEPEDPIPVFRDGVDPLVEEAVFLRVGLERLPVEPADPLPGGDPDAPVGIEINVIDPEIAEPEAGRIDRPGAVVADFPAAVRGEGGPSGPVEPGEAAAVGADPLYPVRIDRDFINTV